MAQRLSKDDWLQAGCVALTEAGPKALKAEPLARRLGTTKGSFYWHFEDVPTFHRALMQMWKNRAYEDIVTLLDQQDSPVLKLRQLAQIAGSGAPEEFGGLGLEPAIRAWARESEAVAQAVGDVDRKRMGYVQELFEAIGLTNPELTRLLYAAFVGMEELSTHDQADNSSALGTLVDLILALHEADG
ncbi:TetR/AcrR family transcriptional regulator [Shimia marina]|uniref:Bacterial regulatory proteins, tetR family n=1 Tax=Shimia marina TaxID=321267 RepID=A0A0P1FFZ2_9RHOB|nr:TetR/AcrR family transcriptional regulator [Shimia marina]CUH53965.1 Bacterial regulatory proteins, tetR family [Shimia marina]SFE18101.1 transcriptional regulator, TetR family [Shimia marina]